MLADHPSVLVDQHSVALLLRLVGVPAPDVRRGKNRKEPKSWYVKGDTAGNVASVEREVVAIFSVCAANMISAATVELQLQHPVHHRFEIRERFRMIRSIPDRGILGRDIQGRGTLGRDISCLDAISTLSANQAKHNQ